MALPQTTSGKCANDWNELTRCIVSQRYERVNALLKNGADVNFTTPVCVFFSFSCFVLFVLKVTDQGVVSVALQTHREESLGCTWQ